MNFFTSYLLQSTVSLILLYGIYWLFLKRDTFFMVNRIYLTGSIIFSLVFPAFKWHINLDGENTAYAYLLETVTITPDVVAGTISNHMFLVRIVTVVYLTGVSLFFIRFVFQLVQVMRLVMKFGIDRKLGMQLVFIDRNYQPFSFFHLIFIPESLKQAATLPQIIEHERVHVEQKHSLDLILLEILTILQWFNPIIWLYRRSVKSLHEYLADEGVIIKGFDKKNYQELLLGQSLGIQVNDLTNNFNHSLLKNRLIMMTKQRSGKLSGWKATLAIPVALVLVMVFSTSVNLTMAQEDPKKPQTVENKELPPPPPPAKPADGSSAIDNEPVYDKVKTMPEFVGGFDGLVNYLVANIKYPEDAKKKGTTGTVLITFVVDKSGRVTRPSILKGVDPLLDAEALRVVSSMPKWKPGLNDEGVPVKVVFNLPIAFSLDDKAKSGENK